VTFLLTVFVVKEILIDYPGKGQAWLYDTIIFTSVGMIAVGYAVFGYLQWREKHPRSKYPSTVRAKLREGFEKGSAKR
jgi:hypothetical protein